MILQVARLVRMQLYRITLSHLYRKLLVTHFHSTVSVLRPAARTSLWLNKQKKKKKKNSDRVFGSCTQSEGLAGRSVTACGRQYRCFFSCCLSDDRLSPCQTSAPLLLCLSGEEKGEGGRWELAWTCDKVRVRSAGKMWPLCFHRASAEHLDVIWQLRPSGETGDKCCCVFTREFIYCACVYFASFPHWFCRSLNTHSDTAAGNVTGNASESDLRDCLSLFASKPTHTSTCFTWAHSCTVSA